MKMDIVFFGSDSFAVKPLEALIEGGYNILCVITQPDRRKGRGLKFEATPVKITAQAAGLKIYQPADVNSADALNFLKNLNADLFIVIAYGQLLSQGVLNLPKVFSINAHASLLPQYRGAAPINRAIINGEDATGVTVIKIIRRMDAGPIILQKKIPVLEDDTALKLEDKLSILAAQALLESLEAVKNKSFTLTQQDEAKAGFAPKLKKNDGRINWLQTSRQIYNLIRGCFDWPGAFTYYKGKLLKIYKAKVSPQASRPAGAQPGEILQVSKEGITVSAGEGGLSIEELQIEGKRRMRIDEFIAGHKISVGEKLG